MSRIEEANERLLSALERLEGIAERRAAAAAAPEAEPEAAADSGASEAELAELRDQLEASRRANAALRSSRDEVSARLDGAIDRLNRVLGG